MHLGRINLVSLLAALGLFFVPWIQVRCKGEPIVSQSGYEAATGGLRLAEGFPGKEQLGQNASKKGPREAILIIGSGAAALIALVAALGSASEPGASRAVSLFALIALGLVIAQTVQGFPIITDIEKDMPQGKGAADAAFAQAIKGSFQVVVQPGLYGYMAALGIVGLLGFLVSPSSGGRDYRV